MNPTAARELLLEQHRQLRRKLERARAAVGPELEIALADLRAAFMEHNRCEEALLEPLLRDVDELADKRIGRMIEEHAGEHAALVRMLASDTATLAAGLAELAEELDAHMQAEERTFLSPRSLRRQE